MALSNKRIIDLPERSALNSDDYTVVDGSNGGTGKYKLSQLQDDVGEAKQGVTQLSQTVTTQGTQVAQNTEDITDLKEDLDAVSEFLYKEVENIPNGYITLKLESGTFLDSDGKTKTNNNYRIRTAEIVAVNSFYSIEIPSEYSAWIFQLNANKELISAYSGDWVSGTIYSSMFGSSVKYLNIAFRKTATPSSDISAFVDTLQSSLKTCYSFFGRTEFINSYIVPRNNHIAEHFMLKKAIPYQTVNGYKLISDGRCVKNGEYKLVKYRVTSGGEYYLRGYSSGDILYQFQPYSGVSTSESVAIGTPATDSVEGIVTSPDEGYYLIFSVPIDDNVSGLYTFVDKDTLIPDYWQTHLNSTIFPSIHQHQLEVGNQGVYFLFFTDQHNQMKCGNLINKVFQELNGDLIVNGGDIINGSSSKSTEIDNIRNLMNAIPNQKQYVVRGNHDDNSNFGGSTSSDKISDSEFYGLCLKDVEKDIVSNKELYYYFDNENQKVRYIILDTGAPDDAVITDEQIGWMVARITELSNDWTAVIFAHQVYTTLNQIDASGTKITNALNALTEGATVACVISGHTHHDQYYVADGGYPIIITTALNAYQESKTQGTPLTRTWGTISEFAFDLFFINTKDRTINVVRVGAGSDRYFTY